MIDHLLKKSYVVLNATSSVYVIDFVEHKITNFLPENIKIV